VHENTPDNSAAGEAVRAALGAAARRRRAREVSAIVWRLAPAVAAAAMALAVIRRWTLWSPWLPVAVLVLGVVALAAYVLVAVRAHAISDAVAAGIDADADLGGELRSASWFAARPRRDDWSDLHLQRAAARLESVNWSALYPLVRAPRARAATAVFAVAALALTVVLPERVTVPRTAAASSLPGTKKPAATAQPMAGELLPPELLAQLQALLDAAELGKTAEAERLASSAELREFLNRLAADPELLKKLAAALAAQDPKKLPTAKQLQALSDRARKAAEMASMSQDMREALEKMADEAEEAQGEQQNAENQEGQPASSDAPQKGDASQANSAGSMQDLSVQMARQADAGGGAGIMMMSNPDDPSSGPPGSGVGGSGSQEAAAAAAMALAEAFSHETVEASQDNQGDNVDADVRRKTEQGTSAVAFTHGAAGQFDKSRAAAPPPVPEARRSGVQTYFIRKQ
jgi:hypothetical protein